MKLKIATLALMAALSASGCMFLGDQSKMQRAVEATGVTDVQIGSAAFFGCSDSDEFSRNWTGKDAQGRPVKGVVCGGFLKGYTVRFE